MFGFSKTLIDVGTQSIEGLGKARLTEQLAARLTTARYLVLNGLNIIGTGGLISVGSADGLFGVTKLFAVSICVFLLFGSFFLLIQTKFQPARSFWEGTTISQKLTVGSTAFCGVFLLVFDFFGDAGFAISAYFGFLDFFGFVLIGLSQFLMAFFHVEAALKLVRQTP